MFNEEFIFDEKLLDRLPKSRMTATAHDNFSHTARTNFMTRIDTSSLKRQLKDRINIWSDKEQMLSLHSRARSLIQLPSNLQKLPQGFFPFRELNKNHRQIQLKLDVREMPVQRDSKRLKLSPAKQLLQAQIMYNRSQAASIQQFNETQFQTTVKDFSSLCRKRLGNIDYERKHMKIKKINGELKSYRPKEFILDFNQQLYEKNRLNWKPQVGEDSLVLMKNNNVFYYGGRNKNIQMPVYDLYKNRWQEAPQPKGVYFVTGTTIHPYEQHHVVFGGQVPISNARQKTLTNKIFKIDLDNNIVDEFTTDGSMAARRCHGSCIYGDYLLVFGGIDHKYRYLNDMFAFNIQQETWEMISYIANDEVQKYLRKGIAKFRMLTVFNKRNKYHLYEENQVADQKYQEGIYIFGGLNGQNAASNRLLLLKLARFEPEVTEPKTKGQPPSARYDYAVSRWNQYMVVYGGRNDEHNPHIHSDCYMLNLSEMYWIRVLINCSFERFGHEMFTNGDDLWIFGGKDMKGHTKTILNFTIS